MFSMDDRKVLLSVVRQSKRCAPTNEGGGQRVGHLQEEE